MPLPLAQALGFAGALTSRNGNPWLYPWRVKGFRQFRGESGWYSIPKRCSTQREESRLRG